MRSIYGEHMNRERRMLLAGVCFIFADMLKRARTHTLTQSVSNKVEDFIFLSFVVKMERELKSSSLDMVDKVRLWSSNKVCLRKCVRCACAFRIDI